jgi:hypothetical protein
VSDRPANVSHLRCVHSKRASKTSAKSDMLFPPICRALPLGGSTRESTMRHLCRRSIFEERASCQATSHSLARDASEKHEYGKKQFAHLACQGGGCEISVVGRSLMSELPSGELLLGKGHRKSTSIEKEQFTHLACHFQVYKRLQMTY